MEEKDPPIIKTLFILFIISLLAVGGFFIYSKFGNSNFNISNVFNKSSSQKQDLGYNFLIPEVTELEENEDSTEELPQDTSNSYIEPSEVQIERDSLLSPEQKQYAFDANVTTGVIGEIVIPKIGVKGNVLGGADGDALMDQGFWMYPSSATPGNGETILMCHRRFFGSKDQRSCWNLDQLQKGDLIQIIDPNGMPIRYEVQTITVKSPDDVNVYETSRENFLKLISCSLPGGVPGGSDYRIVVIAEGI